MSIGELHLIIGCMYSGKSTELLRIINNYRILEEPVLAISHSMDTRYGSNGIISHDNKSYPCTHVRLLNDIPDISHHKIIIIEEAQFFTDLIVFVKNALEHNKIIYVAGLDGDYKQKEFGDILKLIPLCDSIKKLSALCMICKDGTPANYTKRIIENNSQTLVGSIDTYIPTCRKHHH
jgi:thymidine kinase